MLTPMVGYAATALGYVAVQDGTPVPVREIAAFGSIPEPYLAKILHRLSRIGYVVTQRGVGGGVSLAIDPKRTTLLQLCEVLHDPIVRPQCLLGGGACSDDHACPAHDFQRSIRKRQVDFLAATTLHEIGVFEAKRAGRKASAKKPASRTALPRAHRSKRGAR